MIKDLIFRRSLAFALGWTVLIFVLCATPGQYIPAASWLDLLSFDKLVHASMFFVLGTLFFITASMRGARTGSYVLIFFLCVMYGGLLEVMQAKCFSNRSADWQDFAANSFGCLVAALLLSRMTRYLKKQT